MRILEGHAVNDLRDALTVEQVMANGRLFNAGTLDEVWPRQRALCGGDQVAASVGTAT